MEKSTSKSKNTNHKKLNTGAEEYTLRGTAAAIAEMQTKDIIAKLLDEWLNHGLGI